jgi:hypothetical protein
MTTLGVSGHPAHGVRPPSPRQLGSQSTPMLRMCLGHIILPISRSSDGETEGLRHKNPMFMGLSAIAINSWEDYGKISAKCLSALWMIFLPPSCVSYMSWRRQLDHISLSNGGVTSSSSSYIPES